MERVTLEMRRFSQEAEKLGSLMGEDSFVDLRRLGRQQAPAGRRAWVAWRDGSPLGLLVLDPVAEADYELTLAVSEASRRQGIGSQLLGFARAVLEEDHPGAEPARLIALVDQRNRTALSFFEKHAFVRERTELFDHAKLVLEL
ncbi:MAG: GNAT family N-acetyltransferase [Planctomycetota bacterium]